MKVILRYTDCLQDGRAVFSILGKNNVTILGVRRFPCLLHPKVKIEVSNISELNNLLYELNRQCEYEVIPVKIKR